MTILMQGLVLLVSGMGIVFLFLALLVFVMTHSAKIVQRFNHILPDDEPRKKKNRQDPAARAGYNDVKVAIAIAVTSVRARYPHPL
jgi:sodium pump decarboxylase gamma subunit